MNEFKIAWLFPDTLFLHGERGNLLALARYAQMAGLAPEVIKIDFSTEDFDPASFDVIFCAPGEISSFPAVAEWLAPYRDKLAEFVFGGGPLIVTGTSVGLFGNKVIRSDGSEFDGLGIIFTDFRENEEVYGDDVYFRCEYNNEIMEVIGNQIQMGDLIIHEEKPFGEMFYGYGNTGKTREEGVQKWNSIFTNTLGPMLVCNPWLTEEIIKVAAARRELEIQPTGYDMKLEQDSFATKKEFILTKETHLTNCK